MAYENILLEQEGPIVRIVINRPRAMNALNVVTILELIDCFESLRAKSDSVRAVILTGAGEKSFVAGADIAEIRDLDMLGGKELSARGNRLLSLIEKSPVPVIAVVGGFALGGGCEIAMACHLRIASEKAKFGQPEINLGLIPGYGGTQRLPRLIGRGRALDLLLTGRMITASEALEWGLVNQVVPPEELEGVARKTAEDIASKPARAVAAILECIHTGMQLGLDRGLQVEENLFAFCCGTDDKNEGTSAFLEKRKPEFKGR